MVQQKPVGTTRLENAEIFRKVRKTAFSRSPPGQSLCQWRQKGVSRPNSGGVAADFHDAQLENQTSDRLRIGGNLLVTNSSIDCESFISGLSSPLKWNFSERPRAQWYISKQFWRQSNLQYDQRRFFRRLLIKWSASAVRHSLSDISRRHVQKSYKSSSLLGYFDCFLSNDTVGCCNVNFSCLSQIRKEKICFATNVSIFCCTILHDCSCLHATFGQFFTLRPPNFLF